MHAAAPAQIDRWVRETRPEPDVEWLRQLRELAERIDELLAPYVHRGDPPQGARDVRVLRYYLPS
jgi:hypothetical protein